ncbi:MAG TPA: glycosyltransferase [Acidimicrobiales bacterium]|nr:glycosyltransferase [Acidimicrobiales bacterium]
MSDHPSIDVVILTWNDGPLLEIALRSALESTGVEVHAIVVDNASDPPASVPDDPRVTLVVNATNRGVAAARNQGVRASSSPVVCFLDSDARLYDDTLQRLLSALDADPAIGLSAPVFAGQAHTASAGGAPTLARKLARLTNRTSAYAAVGDTSQPLWDVDFAIGALQVFRRDAFESVGGLDESFFYGPEDADFCLRLKREGWRVVQVRDAVCDHPPRRRFRGLLTRRGLAHAWAVTRFLWRHRRFASEQS